MLAGMIVTDRVVRVKVTKPYDQSALARILEMVQNASERKAPAELFIRKFARDLHARGHGVGRVDRAGSLDRVVGTTGLLFRAE